MKTLRRASCRINDGQPRPADPYWTASALEGESWGVNGYRGTSDELLPLIGHPVQVVFEAPSDGRLLTGTAIVCEMVIEADDTYSEWPVVARLVGSSPLSRAEIE